MRPWALSSSPSGYGRHLAREEHRVHIADYILSHVIQGFDDDRSVTILLNCRRAMAKNGKLLLVERIISPGNEPSFGKLLDLQMLVVTGGRERTEAEYRTLLASAGFRLTNIIPTESGGSVIEGVRA